MLRLDPAGPSPDPLTLAEKPAAVKDRVVCIGYPFAEHRDPALAINNFSGNLALQTLAPGVITCLGPHVETVVEHDCQTLGGNLGSPLLSLETAAVTAVHFDGKFLDRNNALVVTALRDLLDTV